MQKQKDLPCYRTRDTSQNFLFQENKKESGQPPEALEPTLWPFFWKSVGNTNYGENDGQC